MHRIALLVLVLFSSTFAASAETVMVPMRDGVKLATEVHMPPEGGPTFPVVLVRTVYGRKDISLVPSLHRAGIGFVSQDTRGHGDSEGQKSYFVTDGWGALQDGVDTVEWLKKQPWYNGKIGTWGSSALGMTSALLAPATDALSAQVIHVAPCDFYDTYLPGGVPQRALSETYPIVMGYEAEAANRRKHPTYDDYWKLLNPKARAGDVTAPGFFVGGWFDIYPQGILDGFTSRQHHGGPGAKGNNMLIIGPWGHNGNEQIVGDITFPEKSNFQWTRLAHQFLRHWLLGEENKIMDQPAVHYYVLGDLFNPKAPGNEWRTADDWPPYATHATKFYFTLDGALAPSAPDTSDALTYTSDPRNPFPTLGGPNVVISGGPRDQRPISFRDDVLKFQTEMLSAPLEVTGVVTVKLFVRSDAVDTDFFAKLIDIYPDGREINLAEGIHRLKFRNGVEKEAEKYLGEDVELEINCESTSVVFDRGHRIGVLISSSNYPRFELNPQTGENRPRYTRVANGPAETPTLNSQVGTDLPPGTPPYAIADLVLDPTSVQTARNTVYVGGQSALILPVRADSPASR